MKKIWIIVLVVLLAVIVLYLNRKKDYWDSSQKDKTVVEREFTDRSFKRVISGDNRIIFEESSDQTDQQDNSDTEEISPTNQSQNKGGTTQNNSCKTIYVIDSPYQKEVGHYETVHHDEITQQNYTYQNYVEYTFYRSDGTTYIISDYDNSFDANTYLQNHIDEFDRYTYGLRQIENVETVVVQPAYDEQVWVVDQMETAEKGHYEEICD